MTVQPDAGERELSRPACPGRYSQGTNTVARPRVVAGHIFKGTTFGFRNFRSWEYPVRYKIQAAGSITKMVLKCIKKSDLHRDSLEAIIHITPTWIL
jgi:hypothetical protein